MIWIHSLTHSLILVSLTFSSFIAKAQFCNNPVFFNKLEVSLDEGSDRLTVSGFDPCTFSSDQLEVIECREHCENSEEIKADYIDCKTICYEDYGQYSYEPDLLDECINQCKILRLQAENACKNDCGAYPEPERTVEKYVVRSALWYTTGLVESFSGPPNWSDEDEYTHHPGYTLTSARIDLPDEPISYCYVIDVSIFYNDGSCCRIIDFGCVQKG